jgi:hypothetical protein
MAKNKAGRDFSEYRCFEIIFLNDILLKIIIFGSSPELLVDERTV